MAENSLTARTRLVKVAPPVRGHVPRWSAGEVASLREHYAIKGAKYCASLIARSEKSVVAMAMKLGIRSQIYETWTEERLSILTADYSANGARYVAERIGLSEEQVRSKAKYLGLRIDRIRHYQRIGKLNLGKPGPSKWTPEMLEVLRRDYPSQGCRRVGATLGIKARAAQTKAVSLGIKFLGCKERLASRGIFWNPEIIEYLKAVYPTMGPKNLSLALGVRYGAVYGAAKRLGLLYIKPKKNTFPRFNSDVDRNKFLAAEARKRWADPEYRSRMLDAIAEVKQRDGYREQISRSMTAAHRRMNREKWHNELCNLEEVLTTRLEKAIMASAALVLGEMTKDDLENQVERIQASTDPKWLLDQLRRVFETTVQQIVLVAAIVRQLEELGHEVDIKIAGLPYIRKIAYGNMIPELYVALEGDHLLLAKASSLPTPDQERIARNEPIKVMTGGGDHRMVPPLSMNRDEIFQVFETGKLRDDTEQVGWLRSRADKESRRLTATGDITVTVDRKRGGIVVAGKFLSATELAHYLAELSTRK